MCHCIGRAWATQEETLNLPGDNDLFPKVCKQHRQPLRGARGSQAVDSEPERGGGRWGKLGQEKKERNKYTLLGSWRKTATNQKEEKQQQERNCRYGVGGVVYQNFTDWCLSARQIMNTSARFERWKRPRLWQGRRKPELDEE